MEQPTERSGQLFTAMMRMQKAWQNITPCAGVSKAQYATLLLLRRGAAPPGGPRPCPASSGKPPVMTVSELARAMNQSLPAMSQRISGLEELGLVERVADRHDRRVSAVRLSARGAAFVDEAWSVLRQQMEQAICTLQSDEFELLLRFLDQVTEQLELLGTKNDGSV